MITASLPQQGVMSFHPDLVCLQHLCMSSSHTLARCEFARHHSQCVTCFPAHVHCLQVHLVLEDDLGNVMPEPAVVPFTSGPDTTAPQIFLRQPCSVADASMCPQSGTAEFCNNVEANSLSAYAYSDEAGATYFALTKLPSSDWAACLLALPDLDPGEMFAVPNDEQWSGCMRQGGAARRSLSSLRSTSVAAAGGSAHMHSSHWAGISRELASARRLQQQSLVPQPGCMAQQPCDCCKVNVNCAVPFDRLWANRAELAAAGDVLASACAYMWASTCAEVPIERALSLAVPRLVNDAGPAAVSAASVAEATAAPAAAPRSLLALVGETDHSMTSVWDAVPQRRPGLVNVGLTAPAARAAPSDAHAAYAARILQQVSASEMELELGTSTSNTSDPDYRQPLYLNTAMLADGLETDAFYALFLVTEDGMRPEPNRLSPAQQYIFRTQLPWPPSCSIACDPQRATLDSVLLTATLNTTGTLCYAVMPSNNTTPPSVQQVRSCACFLISMLGS